MIEGAVDWFISILKRKYNVPVSPKEVGYEAVELYNDGIDPELIELSYIDTLPNPLLAEILLYTDDDNNEISGKKLRLSVYGEPYHK